MDFDSWLCGRLQELSVDDSAFAPYIRTILEGEDQKDQKVEDLSEILSGLGLGEDQVNDVHTFSNEILDEWMLRQTKEPKANVGSNVDGESGEVINSNSKSVNDSGTNSGASQLQYLLKLSPGQISGTSHTSTEEQKSTEPKGDKDLRAAILQQCLQEDSESDKEDAQVKCGGAGLSKNMNAERVLNAQREAKEKAKADAARKREKDREDRARQKKLAEEKKEKAKKKAAKVERKR